MWYQIQASRMATQIVTYQVEAESEADAMKIVGSEDCPLDVGLPVTIPWSREDGDQEIIGIELIKDPSGEE